VLEGREAKGAHVELVEPRHGRLRGPERRERGRRARACARGRRGARKGVDPPARLGRGARPEEAERALLGVERAREVAHVGARAEHVEGLRDDDGRERAARERARVDALTRATAARGAHAQRGLERRDARRDGGRLRARDDDLEARARALPRE